MRSDYRLTVEQAPLSHPENWPEAAEEIAAACSAVGNSAENQREAPTWAANIRTTMAPAACSMAEAHSSQAEEPSSTAASALAQTAA